MEHVRSTELVAYLAGELAEPQRAALERHVAECGDCHARLARQRDVWRALGEWDVEPAPCDVRTMVERRLAVPPRAARLAWVVRAARVAAAVVSGVLCGYGAARGVTAAPMVPTAPGGTNVVDLGVEYLADPASAGLYAALDLTAPLVEEPS